MSTKDALYATFENIPSRKGRGGTYSYVRWQDIADRMNQVFGVNWSSEVRTQDVIENNIIVRVRVTVINPETSHAQHQEGFGGAPNDERAEAGNAFKAAYSKALKDACKKWGIALYLDEEGESASYGGPHIKPPVTTPPAGYTGHETAPAPPPPPSSATPQPMAQPTTATPPAYTPPTTGGMDMPAGVAMAPMNTTQEAPQYTAPPTTPTPAPTLEPELPMSKVPSITAPGGGEDLISDVQKAALQSILSMQGVEYETLAREAFEVNGLDGKTVPGPDALTYKQAVYVVKYGNDKFRSR